MDSCSDHGEPSGSSALGTCMSHELSDKSQPNGIDDVTTLTTDQVSDAVHVITSQGEMTLAPVGNATGLLARGEQPQVSAPHDQKLSQSYQSPVTDIDNVGLNCVVSLGRSHTGSYIALIEIPLGTV